MAYRVEIARSAVRDADAVAAWLAERAPVAAAAWLDHFEAACASLAHLPERGSVAPEAAWVNADVRHVQVGRHRVLYVVQGEAVVVLHVRHGAQLPVGPGEW